MGPKYGYYPEPKKTILIVDPTFKDEANVIFQPFGISVVSGHRFLGRFIGDSDSTRQFVQSKVTEWISCIMELSKAAEKYPQAAFSALSKSLQFEWTYLQRVVSDCSAAFAPVWDAPNTFFWPAVFEGSISETEKRLFTLPTRMGGMGIRNPIEIANNAYKTSRTGTSVIVEHFGVQLMVKLLHG